MQFNKRLVVLILLAAAIILLLVWRLGITNDTATVKKEFKNLSEEIEVEDDVVFEYGNTITDVEETYRIMHEFIKARLLEADIFLEFDLVEGPHAASITELRSELFDRFYMAIKEKDLDHFTFVFSGVAIKELWGEEKDPDQRIKLMNDALSRLQRNEKFEAIRYQFERDEEDLPTDEGILVLEYKDGIEISVPFTMALIGEGVDGYYQLRNSITDILYSLNE